MPTIITRGGMSALGFGFSGGPPPVLQTAYLYASAPWVVPSGVSSLATLQLKGGTGTAGGDVAVQTSQDVVTFTQGEPPTGAIRIDGTPASLLASTTEYASSWVSSLQDTGVLVPLNIYQDADGSLWEITGDIGLFSGVSSVSTPSGPWDNTTTDSVTGSTANYTATVTQTVYYPPTYGTDTTGFGYTAAGGYGGGGATTNVTNVSVVPGRTYNIYVGSGGYVRLQYYI